jgi:hypothetical protein
MSKVFNPVEDERNFAKPPVFGKNAQLLVAVDPPPLL